MKRLLLTIFILNISIFAFSQDLPSFLIEANAGYALGINIDSAIQIGLKLTYPIEKFGFSVEAEIMLNSEKISFQSSLVGFVVFFYIKEKWRIPVTIGFEINNGNTFYYGIGGVISAHYMLTKSFFVGLNIGITYFINNVYDELTGYKTNTIIYNEGIFTQTVPVFEKKNHWGSYIQIRPSILVGLQF